MSDPYYNQPHNYSSTTTGRDGETHYRYDAPNQGQAHQYPQPQYSAHSGHGHSGINLQYHPQPAGQTDKQSHQYEHAEPDDYKHDNSLLSPHYEPRTRGYRGSNQEYYQEPGPSHESIERSSSREHRGREEERNGSGDERERGIGGALVGGATGYYLGHKKHHGILGAVGGALLGNFIENKVDERRDGRHSSHHHSHHSKHYHPARHRSRSRHSHRSRSRHSHRSRSRDSRRSTGS